MVLGRHNYAVKSGISYHLHLGDTIIIILGRVLDITNESGVGHASLSGIGGSEAIKQPCSAETKEASSSHSRRKDNDKHVGNAQRALAMGGGGGSMAASPVSVDAIASASRLISCRRW
jgi:hypothetical protein